MPDYLPTNRIKVEISSLSSNKWIFIPRTRHIDDDERDDKGEELARDIERDPFPLKDVKRRVLSRSYFGCCKVPLEMDGRIIESGLLVLESNREAKINEDLAKKEKIYRAEVKERLEESKRQQDKMEQKFDQMLNQVQNLVKSSHRQN
jgi:hypothetical protein